MTEFLTKTEKKLSLQEFFPAFLKEYEKWLEFNNPDGKIASIPDLRENICSKLPISHEDFDSFLFELHLRGIVWLSKGTDVQFKGKPLTTKLGEKMYAVSVYKKDLS